MVIAAVMGSYETKILGSDSVRAGVMLATDQRIVFYAKKLCGYDLESFAYGSISSFEQSKSMMGHQISFFGPGNKVNLKWIRDLVAVEAFTNEFKARIGPKGPSAIPDQAPAASSSDAVFDQLRQLGQLRDADIVTTEEFEAKKGELLARL